MNLDELPEVIGTHGPSMIARSRTLDAIKGQVNKLNFLSAHNDLNLHVTARLISGEALLENRSLPRDTRVGELRTLIEEVDSQKLDSDRN